MENHAALNRSLCGRSRQHKSRRHQTAFSIIELMVVVAIAGVLMGVAVPAYQEYIERSKSYETIADLTAMAVEIESYLIENGRLPLSLVEIGRGSSVDQWGNPYQYLNISTAKGNGMLRKDKNLVPINTDFDLYSKGPDGASVSPLTAKPSRDDIIRANNGGFYGVAEDY